jgi:hypothetical protein
VPVLLPLNRLILCCDRDFCPDTRAQQAVSSCHDLRGRSDLPNGRHRKKLIQPRRFNLKHHTLFHHTTYICCIFAPIPSKHILHLRIEHSHQPMYSRFRLSITCNQWIRSFLASSLLGRLIYEEYSTSSNGKSPSFATLHPSSPTSQQVTGLHPPPTC